MDAGARSVTNDAALSARFASTVIEGLGAEGTRGTDALEGGVCDGSVEI